MATKALIVLRLHRYANMINQFSSLLLNLSDTGGTLLTAPGFFARILNPDFLNLYNILFSDAPTAQQKYKLCQSYLEIIKATGLEEAFTLSDSRITYKLDSDFNNFKSTGLNFNSLFPILTHNNILIIKVFTYPAEVNVSKYDNLWLKHTNPIFRLGGLLVAYVSRLK